MLTRLIALVPLEGIKIILVLFLSFLVGIEREEHMLAIEREQPYSFGGVRTFPLIGLIGYAMTYLSGDGWGPFVVGFAVTASFLLLSYKHKLDTLPSAGATTEISALATYVIGVLVSRGEFWIATTLAVVSLLLLELKTMLENLSRRLPGEEILAFAKFLLLTAVILPVVPDRTFGSFGFNPFEAWLIVVAASGISYGSYLLQKLSKGFGGVRLAAILGGAYSSTATTVILAKRARGEDAPYTYAGSILMASGVMYLRMLVLIALFNRALLARLFPSFLALGLAALAVGWFWSSRRAKADTVAQNVEPKNPLELSAAFLFAVLFVALLAATHFVLAHFGRGGIYGLAAITGATDVDPFVLGLAQSAGAATPLGVAAAGVIVAAASNNAVKGFYAFSFADRKTGLQALGLLLALAVLGLVPLAF